MKRRLLEPGLLSVFKVYVVLRVFAMLAVGEFFFLQFGLFLELAQIPYVILFVFNIAFLLIYLSLPWLQHKLGRVYLPIALIVAAVGPILEGRYLFIVYDVQYAIRHWLVFPFLLVPLILTAWQYRLRQVVLYCLGTALLEMALVRTSPQLGEIQVAADIGSIIVRSVFFVHVGYIVSHLIDAQREQRRELAEANRKLVAYAATLEQLAISQERNRLARELHDTLAHAFSGLAVQLDAVTAVWDPIPPKARTMLEQALSIARMGLDETRRALRALRATPLEDMGLPLAIRDLAEDAAERGSLSLELDIPRTDGPQQINHLSPEVEQCFYRIAQEALENVVKHADAHRVRVSLEQTGGQFILQVTDDGRGFALASLAAHQSVGHDQLGIKGMRERAELVGGTLDVQSYPGQGTTVSLSVPDSVHRRTL